MILMFCSSASTRSPGPSPIHDLSLGRTLLDSSSTARRHIRIHLGKIDLFDPGAFLAEITAARARDLAARDPENHSGQGHGHAPAAIAQLGEHRSEDLKVPGSTLSRSSKSRSSRSQAMRRLV